LPEPGCLSQICRSNDKQLKNRIFTTLFTVFLLVAGVSGYAMGVSADSSRIGEENNGAIKGKVTTAEGQPAAFVSIQVKGSRRSTLTDEEGNFTLRNLAAGASVSRWKAVSPLRWLFN
jgi:iron complex outermembrane receptor protein